MSSYQQMDSRYTCCCGPCQTTVEKGAFVIALLGSVFNVMALLRCVLTVIGALPFPFVYFSDSLERSIIFGVVYLLSIVMYLLIIVAQKTRRPGYYVPYLVFMGMLLIWDVSMCFLQTGTAIIAPQFMIDEINNEDPESKMNVERFRLEYGIHALVCWLSNALEGWFYSVIYRAYKFMKFNNGQYEGDAADQLPPPV